MHKVVKLVAVAVKAAAIFATVGVVGLGALMAAQAFWVRRLAIPEPNPQERVRSRLFGNDAPGKPLELAILGDSLAIGYGADDPDETVGVLLAKGLAAAAQRPVQLRNAAVVGAESGDLSAQIASLTRPDVRLEVVVIIVGGNDVLHSQKIGLAVRYLASAVRELRRRGCEVVVATCPDMGTVRLFAQPLRFLAQLLSRLLATAQTIVVLRAGGSTVSLADILGPYFRREPEELFSEDQLHPSSQGYARAAELLLPSVCSAAGNWGGWELSLPRRIYRKDSRIRRLSWLAFWAARHSGAEVSAVPGKKKSLARFVPTHTSAPQELD